MIKKFLNRSVEFANKFKFLKEDLSEFIATITSEPGNISEPGTPLSADNFNEIQKNCVYDIIATHRVETDNNVYTVNLPGIEDFGVYENLKLIVYLPSSNTGGTGKTFIELKDDTTIVSTVEVKKKNSDGLNVSLENLDLLKGAYARFKYEGDIWVLTQQANAMTVKEGNITRHNSLLDIPTMQDNASVVDEARKDANTKKIYICVSDTPAVSGPDPSFELMSVWDNRKQIENLFTATTLYEGDTVGSVTHEDISQYDFVFFEFTGYGLVPIHRFIPVSVWLLTGSTYEINSDDANKNSGLAKISNTETSATGYSCHLYKIIGYKIRG